MNHYSRIVGGIESYLDAIMPALVRAGHQLAFIFEADNSVGHSPIMLPQGAPRWQISANPADTIASLRAWGPELLYVHGLDELRYEAALLGMAPSIFFAHSYSGTCVGGEKTHKFPAARPCTRIFGPGCLALYYPRHCGGIGPRTMMRRYAYQAARLGLLRRYDAIVTASEHMRAEYARHGFSSVYRIGLPQPACETAPSGRSGRSKHERDGSGWRLLFAGRMMPLKGGTMLLDALPQVAAALEQPIRLVLAGDGPARTNWEERARVIMTHHPVIQIQFAGWLDRASLVRLYRDSDLLVMPSLWPEPFGLSGVEAGLYGVPAVAFAVGGIPDWLHDGVNGRLAPADPPSALGLARAIVAAIGDPAKYQRLCDGAARIAAAMTISAHLLELERVLSVIGVASLQPSGKDDANSDAMGDCSIAGVSLE